MVSLQPIHLWRYLGLMKSNLPHGIKRLFYLSWEDALWDLLKNKNVPNGSVILVPEFFCGNVEDNIRKHGYKIAHYQISKHLTTKENSLIEKIKLTNPSVIIIFHTVGIHNDIFDKKSWLEFLNPETILIEDSVHQLVDPEKIRLIRKNHFVIDSLRKVIPLQGSNLYGKKEDLNFLEPSVFQSFSYSFNVIMLWLKMLFYWSLSNASASPAMSGIYAEKAEKLMMDGYSVIGSGTLPARGFCIFNFLQQYIDYKRIRKIKKRQVEVYEKKLHNIIPIKPEYFERDKSEIRGWPVILPLKKSQHILNFLRSNGLKIRFELNDSVWSKKQKIIYLPLGPHINLKKQLLVCDLVVKSLNDGKN